MNKSPENIGQEVTKGAVWTVLARLGVRSIGLVSTVILARLLLPEDFGLVAMSMAIIAGLELMGEFGFDTYLISHQDVGRSHYDTAWTLNILRNLSFSLILLVGAEQFAALFKEPRMADVLYFLSLATAISAFQNVGIVDFRKHFQFSKDFAWMTITKVVSFVVTISLAFYWRDYWALIAGIIALRVARVAFSYVLHPYRPRLCLTEWRVIFSYSKWLLLTNVLLFLRRQTDRIVIARFAGTAPLGIYAVAFEISNLPTTELLMPIRRALLPGYAKLNNDPEALARGFAQSLSVLMLVISPAAAGLGLVAGPAVSILLGGNWTEAVPVIQILAVYGIAQVGAGNLETMFLAIQRPRVVTAVNAICAVALIPAMIYGITHYGLPGLATAVAAVAVLNLVFLIWASVVLLHFRLWDLWLAVWRSVVSLLTMIAAVLAANGGWAMQPGFLADLLLLVMLIVIGGTTYIATHLALWMLSGKPQDAAENRIIELVRARLGR